MHDFRQNTNATIGNGTIRTGTTLNLDANNNLISISGGEIYAGDINRDIKIAQLETKHLEVTPIEIRETFDFDTREGSKSKIKRPSIWSQAKDGDIDIVGGLMANAKITAGEFISRINPVNAFSNITYGIGVDIENLGNELGFDKKLTSKVGNYIIYSPYHAITAPVVGAATVSDWIDARNDGIDPETGEPISHPAPNFFTGIGSGETPSVGRGDEGCKNNIICKTLISDEAYHFKILFYGLPGFKSFADFHDAGMVNKDGSEKGGVYKALSIIPYIPISYYGALGTYMNNNTYQMNKPK